MGNENHLPGQIDSVEAHSMQESTEDNGEKDGDLVQSESSVEQLPQKIIAFLTKLLAESKSDIVRLEAKINDNESQRNADINQRMELLKLLSIRDNKIERMSVVIHTLEKQLQAAVTAKFDALARLDAVGGQELTVSFQNCLTEMIDERSAPLKSLSCKTDEAQQEECHDRQKLKGIDNAADHRSDASSKRKRSRKGRKGAAYQLSNDVALDASLAHSEQIESDREASNRENNDDSVSIQDELLSLVRTRRQNQFLQDAFNVCGSSKTVSDDLTTPTGKKARVQGPSSSSNEISDSRQTPHACVVKLRKL